MRYWLTPPDFYKKLDEEFHFDFDPCPYPYKINAQDQNWGQSNWVNPPFLRKDRIGSVASIIRKAIEERAKGKLSVIILPSFTAQQLLFEARAEIRPIGRVKWLEVETKKPTPRPNLCALYILRPFLK